MRIDLVIENLDMLDNGGPTTFSATDHGFSIGRERPRDWVLPDPDRFISGHHCEVRFEDGDFVLVDHSTNGTFVNGSDSRLRGPHRLCDGDRIHIGNYVVAVRLDDPHGSSDVPLRGGSDPYGWGEPAPGDDADATAGMQSGWSIDGPFAPPIDLAPPRQPRPSEFEQHPVDLSTGWDSGAWGNAETETSAGPRQPTPPPSASPFDEPWSGEEADDIFELGQPEPLKPRQTTPNSPRPLRGEWDEEAWGQRPPPPEADEDGWPPARPSYDRDRPRPAPPSGRPHPIRNAPARRAHDPASMPASPDPRQPAPAERSYADEGPARPTGDDRLLQIIAETAGLDPRVFAGRRPEEAAREIGLVMSLATDGIIELLRMRAKAKTVTRSANRTTIEAAGNNALKFSPNASAALAKMLGAEGPGYLSPRESFSEAFRDLSQHEMITFAAMQKALKRLLDDLSPESIEERAPSSLVPFSKKAQAWDLFVTRWDAKTEPFENGMLDVFLQYFREIYDQTSRSDRG
ncbi:type VI secretion system-associated FHA domain protein TagH [Jiella marina]|uniref:type VI secretion system-associated FHA domain protein TagH n=1 Tax=Jiella sp. LLJ827 TaxID=2917712 RepID=UPI0021012FD9|nr:type VI secretion system-associated FHA domain protein TagH [Jiella sp. LLJ827]MCQ0989520.1 type VI secretion system-associated FHA domain protein TagH [Jiella sp. LLJ827]